MLTDFGLAKGRAYTVLTRPGQVMGTLDYLAPELIKGEPGEPGERHLRARLHRLRVRRRPAAVRRQGALPGRPRAPRGAAARPGQLPARARRPRSREPCSPRSRRTRSTGRTARAPTPRCSLALANGGTHGSPVGPLLHVVVVSCIGVGSRRAKPGFAHWTSLVVGAWSKALLVACRRAARDGRLSDISSG